MEGLQSDIGYGPAPESGGLLPIPHHMCKPQLLECRDLWTFFLQQISSQDDVGISAEVFDSLLEQSHISNLLASQNNSLPWELEVQAAIFSDTWDGLQHNLGVVIPSELPEVKEPESENPVTAALERMRTSR